MSMPYYRDERTGGRQQMTSNTSPGRFRGGSKRPRNPQSFHPPFVQQNYNYSHENEETYDDSQQQNFPPNTVAQQQAPKQKYGNQYVQQYHNYNDENKETYDGFQQQNFPPNSVARQQAPKQKYGNRYVQQYYDYNYENEETYDACQQQNISSNSVARQQTYKEERDDRYGQKPTQRGKTGKGFPASSQPNRPRLDNPVREENDKKPLFFEFDEKVFEKRFDFPSFREREESELVEKLFKYDSWSIDKLVQLKSELNEIRIPYCEDRDDKWYKLRTSMRPDMDIKTKLMGRYDIEMCTFAWLKITELYNKYSGSLIPCDLPDKPIPKFRTLHLCEAPGAFICATNHFLRQIYDSDIDWDWTAVTLNLYNEDKEPNNVLLDDRFMIDTLDHWHFGFNNTGDIMDAETIKGLWQKYQNDKVNLVTADGSFESNDKAQEETKISHLLYAEVVTALGVLKIGGSFIMEIFGTYECQTVCLFYLLAIYFDTISVTKPVTSHADNAEKYVVCTGFRDISDGPLNELLKFVNTPLEKSMFPQDFIPESFLEQMSECSQFFTTQLIQIIERNEDIKQRLKNDTLYHDDPNKRINKLKESTANMYFEKNNITSLNPKYRLVKKVVLDGSVAKFGNSLFSWHDSQPEHLLKPPSAISSKPKNVDKSSIPFKTKNIDESSGIEDEPFFDDIDPPPESFSFNQNSIFTGKRLTRVLTSFIARKEWLEDLYKLRNEVFQKHDNEFMFKLNSKYLFLSEYYAELGSTNFYYSQTAIELQSVDRYLNVVNSFKPSLPTDPLLFVVLPSLFNAAENLGYAEYIVWQQQSQAHGLVFTTNPDISQLKSSLSISCHLSNKNVEETFKEFIKEKTTPHIQLIIGDVSVPYDRCMTTELVESFNKYEFVQTCLNALNILSRQGHFICKISDTFTRFTIQLIYILYMSFEKVTIIKPFTLNPALPDRFLVCQNYLGRNNLYIEHLNSCLCRMTELKDKETEIVQIIPLTCFKPSLFMTYMREQTKLLMKREYQALKKLSSLIETDNPLDISCLILEAAERIKTPQRDISNADLIWSKSS